MKIAMVIPYDLVEEGGVKRHAMQLASTLRGRGDEVDVIGPCSDPSRDLGEGVHGFGGVINIPANHSDNRLGIFTPPWEVYRLFRQRRYDVVHIHEPLQPALNYWALWSAGAAARVATFHAFVEDESPGLQRAQRIFGTLTFPLFDRGIAVSPAAASNVERTFQRPLTILPNGIRTALYKQGEARVAGSPLKILFVGHWRDARKGLPHLLDACAELDTRGVAWTLDVVGDGGTRPASSHPRVRYHGAISSEGRVAEMYAACDVFVAPSTGAESFGIVLLEAMAAARPIVCSDIPGYRYAVGDGPRSGAKLVAPGNVSGIANALAQLASDSDECARLGAVNRERVAQFDWDHLVTQVREEYIQALDSPRRRGRRRWNPLSSAA
ncbi:MAG TPA: glycosyltransferase family 4 protein [Kofleriaceae bacterium]|jgi:phosphatidylinositol alpha-mannosyltransferase